MLLKLAKKRVIVDAQYKALFLTEYLLLATRFDLSSQV